MKTRMFKACLAFTGLICLAILSACSIPFTNKTDELEPYRVAMLPHTQNHLDYLTDVPRYDIALHVDMDNLVLTGHESILYTNNQSEAQDRLYFRLYPNLPSYNGDLQIVRVKIGEQEIGATYEANRTALKVPLPTPLHSNHSLRLELDFRTQVRRFGEQPALLGESQGILSVPNFYPMLAVCQNGSWDLSTGPEFADAVFSDIALYRVNIDVPENVTVVSSGAVISKTDTPEKRQIIHYVSGPARDFGLIMSRDFEKQSLQIRGITINSYYLPQDAAAGYSALWRAAAAIQVFDDAFSDYPYTKFDVAEAPLGKRGMEYPSLVFIGSEVYRTDKKRLEPLVVHETAHQWWYNLVGSDPVNEPAVDEGLAEYSLYYYYQEVYGKRRADEIAKARWAEPYQFIQENDLDAPVEQPAINFNPDNYEAVVYAKSSALYTELNRYIGDETFNKSLRHYLDSYRYRIAPAGAFLGIVSGNTSQNLEAHLRKWREITPLKTQEPQ